MLTELQRSRLREAAVDAIRAAYCPYSGFPVGAAVMTDDGSIFSGCNVENASYGLTICAERNAIFQAVAKGHSTVRAVAVVTKADAPTLPCGACRQVISEFGPDADVFSFTADGLSLQRALKELLPESFGPHDLADSSFPGRSNDE